LQGVYDEAIPYITTYFTSTEKVTFKIGSSCHFYGIATPDALGSQYENEEKINP
jgi:hypothetical protein